MRFAAPGRALALTALSAVFVGCGASPATNADGGDAAPPDGGQNAAALRITELCAQDDGFLIDERGQTEDWVEIANVGTTLVELGGFALADDKTPPVAL